MLLAVFMPPIPLTFCAPTYSCCRWAVSPLPSGSTNYAAFRFTPSSVVSSPGIPLVWVLSTISSLAFGLRPTVISLAHSSQNATRSLSKAKRVKKPLLPHPKRWSDWLIGFCFVMPRSHLCHSISSCPCFATSLYRSPRHLVSSVTCQLSLSRETELLCEPLPSLVASAYVIKKR